ncbi:MAG: DinB family protein [Chloroflexota bacterium]|nr:MAG: DinB family protein [Chloroflexota bacterium]
MAGILARQRWRDGRDLAVRDADIEPPDVAGARIDDIATGDQAIELHTTSSWRLRRRIVRSRGIRWRPRANGELLAPLLYQAWSDLDRAIVGLSDAQMIERPDGPSAFAWTVAHVSQQVDSWLNARFQHMAPGPILSHRAYYSGGIGDAAHHWPAIRRAVDDVRSRATHFLESPISPDLDARVAYTGGIAYLRMTGLSLCHALMHIAAHHFLHVGEIITLRTMRGLPVESNDRTWGQTFA